MKNIIFIAPPAAGKGTQSKILSEKYNIPHISTGDLLRNTLNENSDLSLYIKKQMKSGILVSDDLIIKLLSERLKQDDCNNGYILDGFPRNVSQAISFEGILKSLDKEIGYVILLDISREIAKGRIIGRLICSNCGKVYNNTSNDLMPVIEGICDECGGSLSRRFDDNEVTFEKRFDEYIVDTLPLIEYYEKKGVLYKVDSSINTSYTKEQIEKILEGN